MKIYIPDSGEERNHADSLSVITSVIVLIVQAFLDPGLVQLIALRRNAPENDDRKQLKRELQKSIPELPHVVPANHPRPVHQNYKK